MQQTVQTTEISEADLLLAKNQEVERVFNQLVDVFKKELIQLETAEIYKTWIAIKHIKERSNVIHELSAYLFHLLLDENERGEYRIELCFDDSIIDKQGKDFYNSLLRHFYTLTSSHTTVINIENQLSFDPIEYDVHSFFLAQLEEGSDECVTIGKSYTLY